MSETLKDWMDKEARKLCSLAREWERRAEYNDENPEQADRVAAMMLAGAAEAWRVAAKELRDTLLGNGDTL